MLSIVTITLEPLRKKEEQKLVFRQPFTGPQNTMVPLNSRIFFNHLQFPLDFLVFIGYLLMPPTVKYRFYTGTLFCSFVVGEMVDLGCAAKKSISQLWNQY